MHSKLFYGVRNDRNMTIVDTGLVGSQSQFIITIILGAELGPGLDPPPPPLKRDSFRILSKWRAPLQSTLTLPLITLRTKVTPPCPMQKITRNRLRTFLSAQSYSKLVKSDVESPGPGDSTFGNRSNRPSLTLCLPRRALALCHPRRALR